MSAETTDPRRPLSSGTALGRALSIRTELLERLGAEEEWLTLDDDELTPIWCPGPNPTYFQVLTPRDSELDLVSIRLVTLCSYANNIDVARFLVWDLNLHTTLNRWVVLGDPGPADWRERLGSSEFAKWADHVWRAPTSEGPTVIAVEVSFIIADPAREIPISVMELVAREQIAKANALTTNDAWTETDQLGVPVLGGGTAGTVRTNEFNDVLFHHDNVVEPRRRSSPHRVFNAVADAYARSVEALEGAGYPAWRGTSNEQAIEWEVPYGPGPYPGIIASSVAGPPRNARHETSLVRVLGLAGENANPHRGNGVIFIMRVANPTNFDNLDWNAALLNGQSHFFSNVVSAMSAHGIGAWLDHDGDVKWSMFIPAYWAEILPQADLAQFMDEAIANTARLSWASRAVLEQIDAVGEPQPGGFAAGLRGRGPSFGETGSGIKLDP